MHKNKEQLLMHYENSIEWVKTLLNLSETQWRTPIAKDKWTIAEIIGHFPAWDQFVLKKRIPYFFTHQELPKAPDENELNDQSSKVSKEKSKEEIIEDFIAERRRMVIAINNIEDELWDQQIKIGETSLTISDYLSGFIEHDIHHFKQIEELLLAIDGN
ncbi:DinB family protein [Ureibacillus sp. 179-F W5.1 NHS]|uniref:DinB family protein n=1 Tax=Ureibacillus sp. 179-F W5.1 NHS TaxID=3374297 RepID=UPI003879CAFD